VVAAASQASPLAGGDGNAPYDHPFIFERTQRYSTSLDRLAISV